MPHYFANKSTPWYDTLTSEEAKELNHETKILTGEIQLTPEEMATREAYCMPVPKRYRK